MVGAVVMIARCVGRPPMLAGHVDRWSSHMSKMVGVMSPSGEFVLQTRSQVVCIWLVCYVKEGVPCV